jgi:hypothetical protein
MDLRPRYLLRILLPAALVLGVLAVAASALAAPRGDTSLAHVDGYVSFSPDSHCVVVRQHDGSLYTLVGRWHGLVGNDHVRLEGRFVPETRCGGQGGFEVTEVQAIWADDNHRSTYYDHLKDGTFRDWLSHNRPREFERERERERREPPRS